MPRRGIRLPLYGFLLGLLAGLLVVLLREYIESELVQMLEGEVADSTPCRFAVDRVDLSLLGLSVTAKRPRIECGKNTALLFRTLEGEFSLARWKEHRIELTELRLIDGYADGVGPKSPTYEFINHLAAPLPPERDRPGRWKVKLMKLVMSSSRFREVIGSTEIQGNGARLTVERTPSDDFNLTPAIANIAIARGSTSHGPLFTLGEMKGGIFLEDSYVDFSNITQLLGPPSDPSVIRLDATTYLSLNNALTGNASFQLSSEHLPLPHWFHALIEGDAQLSGAFEYPTAQGTVLLPADSEVLIAPTGIAPLRFDSMRLSYRTGLKPEGAFLEVPTLRAEGPQCKIELTTPFSVNSSGWRGTLAFRQEPVQDSRVSLGAVELTARLSGEYGTPKVELQGSVGSIEHGALALRKVNVSGTLTNELLALDGRAGDEQGGTATLAVKIGLTERAPFLDGAELSLSNFSPLRLPAPATLSLSGRLRMENGARGQDFSSSGAIAVAASAGGGQLLLQGPVKLTTTGLSAALATTRNNATLSLEIPFSSNAQANLTLGFNALPLTLLFPGLKCGELDGRVDYAFSLDAPEHGKGKVAINQFSLGCAPYQISLNEPQQMQIVEGKTIFESFPLRTAQGELRLSGEVSARGPQKVQATGTLYLNSLLPLVPMLDDLEGVAQVKASFDTERGTPRMSGQAQLSQVEADLESLGVSVRDGKGALIFRDDAVQITGIEGKLNQGTVNVRGNLKPWAWSTSSLDVSLRGFVLEPSPDVSVELSGELSFAPAAPAAPRIAGNITIDSASIERRLDLLSMIKSLRAALAERKGGGSQRVLPPLALDLRIAASRNILLLTNLLSAELSAELAVQGTLLEPILRGRLETLSGWARLRDRIFEITNGTLSWKQGDEEPMLQALGEASVFTRDGSTVLVLADISGPASNPRVVFSSDRGTPQSEILEMLAAGGTATERLSAFSATHKLQEGALQSLQDRGDFDFSHFLRALATIDSLSLEPSYHTQAGTIEPAIVAEKKLTEALSLIGESSVSGNLTESQARVLYALSPSLTLSALVESVSSKKTNAVGVDLSYTVLARQRQNIAIDFEGNLSFGATRLLRELKLSPSTRLARTGIPQIIKALTDFYLSQGFFGAAVVAECRRGGDLCRELHLRVREGDKFLVEGLRVEGEGAANPIVQSTLAQMRWGIPATTVLLERTQERVTRALRGEGFISARIEVGYTEGSKPASRVLALKVYDGQPVSFTFRGNTQFTAAQFLDSINLFKRKQPFGKNTINILVQNIDRMYREAGYLYATISPRSEVEEGTGRIRYLVDITEEQVVPVREVRFEGVEENVVRRLVSERVRELSENIFSPVHAVAEEVERNATVLQYLLVWDGYPNAGVTGSLQPADDGSDVTIRYRAVLGSLGRIERLEIGEVPEALKEFELPQVPISHARLSQTIEQLTTLLHSAGYRSPTVTTHTLDRDSHLMIEISPGTRTTVRRVLIDGTGEISEEEILKRLPLKPGDPWDRSVFDAVQRRLLGLGLFSRVTLSPADGAWDEDEEDLLVAVEERALRTLELGGGYNSEYGAHLFAEASDRSIFKDGKSLSLRADLFYDPATSGISQGVAGLQYSDPTFRDSAYSFTTDLRFQRLEQTTQEFNLDRLSLSPSWYRVYDNHFTNSFGYTILTERLNEVRAGAQIGPLDSGTVRLGFFSGSLVYDARDSLLNPSHGFVLGGEYKLSAKPLGSEADFLSMSARGSWLLPLSATLHPFTLAVSGRVGKSWTFGSTSVVPISQRYYLGGRATVRGFEENSLGPRGEDGAVIGGEALLSQSSELRYALYPSVEVHAFLDLGTVYSPHEDFSLSDLRKSTGFGFRYLSPIGPIGFDVGFPLEREAGEDAWRLHFSVGAPF